MCQLFGISASEPIKVGFSWPRFIERGSATGDNPDGWGVAFMDKTDVNLLREPIPAAESPLVRFLARDALAADLVISHVRRATRGELSLANTQPFSRRMGGRTHVFAHNGFVPPAMNTFDSVWLESVGETDSEVLFNRLLAELVPLWSSTVPPSLDERTAVIRDFAARNREKGALNFLYSDGLTLFVHGHRRTVPGEDISTDPGLHIRSGLPTSGRELCEGVSISDQCRSVALVATEPLDDGPWRPLGNGELLRIEQGAIC